MTVVLAAALLLGVPVAGLAWALARVAETRLAAPGLRLALWTAAIGAAPVLLLSAVVLSFVPQEVATSPAPAVTLEAFKVDLAPTAGTQENFALQPATIARAVLGVVGVGAALALAGLALRARRLARLLASAASAELEAHSAVRHAADRVQVRAPRVLRAPGVAEPMLAGLFRPALLLPADGPAPDARVLAHELAHLKRGDHRALWSEALLVALFWFNPFIRLSARRASAAREEACDALALHGASPEERRLYARILVDTLRPAAGPPLAIPFGGQGRSPAMRRLDAVLSQTPRASALSITVGAAVGLIALGGAVAAGAIAGGLRDPGAPLVTDLRTGRVLVDARLLRDGRLVAAPRIEMSSSRGSARNARSGDADSYNLRLTPGPDGTLAASFQAPGLAAPARAVLNVTSASRPAPARLRLQTRQGSVWEVLLTATATEGRQAQASGTTSPSGGVWDISALQFRYAAETCTAYYEGQARLSQGDRSWSADRIEGRYDRSPAGKCGPQLVQIRLLGSVRVDGGVPTSGSDELIMNVAPAPAAAVVRLPSPNRVTPDGRPLPRDELATVAPDAVRGVEVNTRTGDMALRTMDAQQAPAP